MNKEDNNGCVFGEQESARLSMPTNNEPDREDTSADKWNLPGMSRRRPEYRKRSKTKKTLRNLKRALREDQVLEARSLQEARCKNKKEGWY